MIATNGMLFDIRRQSLARKRLLLICQAAVPIIVIAMTTASCSGPSANMPEPRYRIVERDVSLSSRLTGGEDQQPAQRRFDEQPRLRAEQHRTSPAAKTAKLHGPDGASVSNRSLQKANTPPLFGAEEKHLYQQFLEWRSRQKDVPQ